MRNPVISTITPCYKMKPYLKRFLDELPKQTIFNQIEVVLDHNDPDDEEILWVQDFQKKYPGIIKHIITRPVQFIGPSMNLCIKESSAQLLTIWNVDDLRTPNSLELQVKAFKKGADFVYGNFIIVRKFGTTTGSLVDVSKYQNQTEAFRYRMLLGPFMAFRKTILDKTGVFDEQLKSGADYDLAIRLAFHGNGGFCEGNLGYYLNEGKGASTRPDSKQPLERTVIDIRYGNYDTIDYDYAIRAYNYDINNIYINGQKIPVESLIPEYNMHIAGAQNTLIKKGLKRYAFKKFLRYKEVVNFAKKIIKRYWLGIK